jgi:hypothetical protein
MTAALVARGVPDPTAHLAATGLARHALAALDDLRAATASLG